MDSIECRKCGNLRSDRTKEKTFVLCILCLRCTHLSVMLLVCLLCSPRTQSQPRHGCLLWKSTIANSQIYTKKSFTNVENSNELMQNDYM